MINQLLSLFLKYILSLVPYSASGYPIYYAVCEAQNVVAVARNVKRTLPEAVNFCGAIPSDSTRIENQFAEREHTAKHECVAWARHRLVVRIINRPELETVLKNAGTTSAVLSDFLFLRNCYLDSARANSNNN